MKPHFHPSLYRAQAMGFIPPLLLAAMAQAGGMAWRSYQRSQEARKRAALPIGTKIYQVNGRWAWQKPDGSRGWM